jgi:hypothetical protein
MIHLIVEQKINVFMSCYQSTRQNHDCQILAFWVETLCDPVGFGRTYYPNLNVRP